MSGENEKKEDRFDGDQPDSGENTETWESDRQDRETWAGKFDFILSGIGYAVGLGNIWRFPYMCAKNGGGAFLIPYCIFLVLCGIPLSVMEMSLGQFVSLCPTALFQKFCPLFQGIGWSQVLVSAILIVYYNMVVGWAVYFLFLSFRSSLMWTSCGNWWNTDDCVSGIKDLANETLLNETGQKMTASEEFWQHYVLRISESSGIDDLGSFQWQLVASFAVAWILVFGCLFKGVHTSGRVVYVTATFPYVVLVVLLCRGLTLPGAMDGIKYYFIPEWEKLIDVDVWIKAALQIFYSVGPGWGGMITFASFNKFNHKVYRDATIVPIVNCGTSIFAGVAVFSIIGYMAKEAGRDVGDVILQGPGLAFSVYPEALAKFPLAPLWAVLFFTMIITVGLDSQFGMVETVVMAFVDTWPGLLRKRKSMFTGFLCFMAFILGLPCTTQGGMYVVQLMDWYSAMFTLMLVSAIECLLLSYNYGLKRFMSDLYLMNNRYPSKWLICAWAFVTPVVVILLMIINFVKHVPATYRGYQYPDWGLTVGWCIAIYSSLPIPIYMVLNVCWRRRHLPTLSERIVDAMRPTPDWGPSRLDDRALYYKSLNEAPSKQLYVKGVEQEVRMVSVNNNESENDLQQNEFDEVPLEVADTLILNIM